MKKNKETILVILLSLSLLFSVFTCHNRAVDADRKGVQITQLQLDSQKSKEVINSLGQKISVQDVIITNDRATIKAISDSSFNLRKNEEKKISEVIAYYKGITKTTIKEVKVPYIDTIKQKSWEDSIAKQCAMVIDYYEANSIAVPRDAKDSTENYYIDLTTTKSGIIVNNLSIPDSQYLRFVEKKRNIWQFITFQKRKIEVQVRHTNPLIQVTGQNSIIYIPKGKTRWLERALLVGVGIYLGIKL